MLCSFYIFIRLLKCWKNWGCKYCVNCKGSLTSRKNGKWLDPLRRYTRSKYIRFKVGISFYQCFDRHFAIEFKSYITVSYINLTLCYGCKMVSSAFRDMEFWMIICIQYFIFTVVYFYVKGDSIRVFAPILMGGNMWYYKWFHIIQSL